MNVRIKFLGAAATVTGSKYLLEIDQNKILVDCGLFQGEKELRLKNWDSFPLNPEEIDAVLLTHAHIDHSGYLPRLVKQGFKGNIYCTEPTAALLEILLMDAAKLQEEETAFAIKKGYSIHKKPEPLFNTGDVLKVFPLVQSIGYDQTISVLEHTKVSFYNAGHILGASIVKIELEGNNQQKSLVFSGDLGRQKDPILYPPHPIEEADILLVESTYGNRTNPMESISEELVDAILSSQEKGGCLLIPAFAVGRTQLILHEIKNLQDQGRIPKTPIYIDSPMAINTTGLYRKYDQYHQLKDNDKSNKSHPDFDADNIHYYKAQSSSLTLNTIKKDAIIISASGMCTGGRILHHMYHRLPNKKDTILFVGYQPPGTRGRKILDGDKEVRIFGESIKVACSVAVIDGLSAHADQNELVDWLNNFKKSPKKTFVIHGEKQASENLKNLIINNLKWNAFVPEYLESFQLFENI